MKSAVSLACCPLLPACHGNYRSRQEVGDSIPDYCATASSCVCECGERRKR